MVVEERPFAAMMRRREDTCPELSLRCLLLKGVPPATFQAQVVSYTVKRQRIRFDIEYSG